MLNGAIISRTPTLRQTPWLPDEHHYENQTGQVGCRARDTSDYEGQETHPTDHNLRTLLYPDSNKQTCTTC